MDSIEMEKAYSPKDFEKRIYEAWEKSGSFKPNPNGKGSFTVVIPPPNVTGVLHMGHGLNNTLQDIVVRYHRMNGEATLWLPGTDHAGIATQNVVERRLKAEGKSRHDVGRDAFLEKTWKVKAEHHAIITEQLRRLGASVDWSRERFTLDEGLSRAVRHVFVTLYERGLIYRGNYLINWCPSCGTALADDEVSHEDTHGAMFHILYPIENSNDFIEIATTRPETLLGDTAVAVHPEDERYQNVIGKNVLLPLTGRKIPIIADSFVDKEFGTGAVKITPAHDPNDWEAAKRNNLKIINILNPDGTLNEAVPKKYQNMACPQARKLVIADLEALGLYKGKKEITHAVGHCYRCNTVVEPYLSDQWFVKMKPLAEKALSAWEKGDIIFYPRKWENTYTHWMKNIRDWCISRQLWWGHRIPVWYCESCGKMIVSETDPTHCPHCSADSSKLKQDEDVLDTWFSSWLWPFSTLGWNDTIGADSDYAQFYPTTALVTAYDIIFFWVSRMVMAGLEFTNTVPFRDIYIHGLVRDKQGRKMSKSLGNGIDPIEIIDTYGSDALKFTLGFMAAQGQDVLVDTESFKMGSRFANKIWNASRYILGNLQDRTIIPLDNSLLNDLDCWIFGRLNNAVEVTRSALENYRFNDAASALYEFFWNDFCDWYVEGTKLSFRFGDNAEKDRAVSVLLNVLEESLRLLHPYLPFVTEEIYSKLPLKDLVQARKISHKNANETQTILSDSLYEAMLITAPYPLVQDTRKNEKNEHIFLILQDLIRSIRALRAECGIAPDIKLDIALNINENSVAAPCTQKTDLIKLLAGVDSIDFVTQKPAKSLGAVGEGYEAFVLVQGKINAEQLKERFLKEIHKEQTFVNKLSAKLQGKFVENAPKDIVEAEREKKIAAERRLEKLSGYMQGL